MSRGMSDQETQPATGRAPVDMDTGRPHPARVYDYWLTGTENTKVDRLGAECALQIIPEFRDYAVGNRKFLVRATRFLAAAGVRQFLDIGAGFLTSPSVHEVAQAADPASRVAYVDNDPMVVERSRERLAGN